MYWELIDRVCCPVHSPLCQVGIVALIVVNVVNSGLVEADFGGARVLYFLARLAKAFVLVMVAVVQLVEHLVVIQDVAGSSPVVHPCFENRDVRKSDPDGSLFLCAACALGLCLGAFTLVIGLVGRLSACWRFFHRPLLCSPDGLSFCVPHSVAGSGVRAFPMSRSVMVLSSS